MKKLRMLLTLTVFAVCAPILNAQDSGSVTLPAEDVKQLRRLAADRDFQKERAELAESQAIGWQRQSERWKGLYESEKNRADNVAGGEIAELRKENTDLRGALTIARTQMDADRQKIGEQNAQIISLKSGRKWWLATGAALGGIGGFFVGKNVNQIRTFVLPEQTAARGFTLRF